MAHANSTGEASNLRLVGHQALQGRPAYQPVPHFQNGRWILYVGHHDGAAQNPLSDARETNGTTILDVTDPSHPVYLNYLPGEVGKVHMLRTNGQIAHQVWHVTRPEAPVLVSTPALGR